MSSPLPQRVFIQEVAPRDGLQMEPHWLDTDKKIALIDAISATGVAKIEVTSFVSPKKVPNLADAAAVVAGIARRPDVTYVALVPNLKGARAAIAARIDEINLVMSASETHNAENMGMACRASLEAFGHIVPEAKAASVSVNGTIATAFGCPFEGPQSPVRVLEFADRYLAMGFDGLTLADTTGMANPRQVKSLVTDMLTMVPPGKLTLHFHNTRGMALANVLAAMEAGAVRFDASAGGIGGCPFAPGATGNVCTEDLVHMLAEMGIETGVDLPAFLNFAKCLPGLLGHDVPGQIIKAGRSCDLHAVPPRQVIAGQ
jgi:hydroxymethylglutaryl-CoA lyase